MTRFARSQVSSTLFQAAKMSGVWVYGRRFRSLFVLSLCSHTTRKMNLDGFHTMWGLSVMRSAE